MARRPTLLDVARAAGVSRSTVSYAYNQPDRLSDEMRARVLAAAREVGYAGPDPLAASRQGSSTLTSASHCSRSRRSVPVRSPPCAGARSMA